MIKKISLVLITFLLVALIINNVFATEIIPIMDGIQPESEEHIDNVLGFVIKMIQYVGSGIALIVITMYGIKYMLASPADKADVKKQILPIIIGCVLIFGTVNLVSVVASLAGVLSSAPAGE